MNQIDNLLKEKPAATKAVVAFLIDGDNVLLGLRKKVSNGLGELLISGIGGKLDPGETNEDALIREIEEEIEVEILEFEDYGRIQFFWPNKPKWNQDVRIYIVTKWDGIPVETEPIKPMWYKRDELPYKEMWVDNEYWLPLVLSGDKIDAVFLYEGDRVTEHHIKKL